MKFGLPPSDLGKLMATFHDHPEIEKVIVFGSRAKGNYRPGSDIDLAIFFNSPLPFNEWLNLQIELDELDLPQKIDLVDVCKIESQELSDHIDRVGKVLYAK